eukprot:GEMP01020906.1.p1 GENE.GEMP01020906.1~~GEMP01020906.1.p1  ORF type:complete len:691 (+),score=103.22 GEMP01020906.1:152-2224(+)
MQQLKQGIVHQVLSGDTLVVAGPTIQPEDGVHGLRATKIIRLCGISAPESAQAFHHFFQSRKFLREKLLRKQISFIERSQDDKARHWCSVQFDGHDLALLIIQQGWAKATKEGTDSDHYSRLKSAMIIAQREKRGIFGLEGVSPPLVRQEHLNGKSGSRQGGDGKKKMVRGVIDDLVQDGTLKVIVPPTEHDARYLGISPVRLMGLEFPLSNRAVRFLLAEQLLSREVQLVGDSKTPPTIVPQLELMKNLVRKGLLRLTKAIDANLRTQLAPLEREAKNANLGIWPYWIRECQKMFQVTIEVTTKPLELPACLDEYLESKFGPVGYVERLSMARALVFFLSETDAENCARCKTLDHRLEAQRESIRRSGADEDSRNVTAWQSQKGPADPRVKQLISMGFSEQVSRNALVECKWDVNLALDKLISQSPESTEPTGPGPEVPVVIDPEPEAIDRDAAAIDYDVGESYVPSGVEPYVVNSSLDTHNYDAAHLNSSVDSQPNTADESVPNAKADTSTVETEVADDDDTASSPEGSVTKNGDTAHRPPDIDMTYINAQSAMHERGGPPVVEKGVRVKIHSGFDPEGNDPRYLRLRQGDEVTLLVADHSESGWAYGRIGDIDGWFPRNCMGELDLVTAKYEFIDPPEDSRPYLKLYLNTICIVEHRFDCGWWLGSTLSKPDGHVGVKGYFPANFVQ